MRRIGALLAAGALALAAVAAVAGAASVGEAEPAAAGAEAQKKKTRPLPPLPANIRQRGRLNIGVKCDAPPFGYIDVRGQHAGFEIEMARWFSRFAFGKPTRVNFTCLTTPAREPALTSDRVDMVIATFTYTPDRDTRIDFSRAYYKATGRLLVRNDAPNNYLSQLAGKTVATTSGSIYDRWMRNCFKDTRVLVTDSLTNAVLEFRNGRADAVMWDDTVLLGIATADRSLKLTNDTFLPLPYGIGIKQGNTELKRWIDSRLEVMRKRDTFNTILRNNVPARLFPSFQRNILRPNNTFGYTQGDPTTQCP
ncbi:MAG TPA: transporter substrate-binding domain-containing protein [Gaiellaceae bacterium]|nr:transporter substrate-binding domain-containing protein [Gaiellaceae bacterium]